MYRSLSNNNISNLPDSIFKDLHSLEHLWALPWLPSLLLSCSWFCVHVQESFKQQNNLHCRWCIEESAALDSFVSTLFAHTSMYLILTVLVIVEQDTWQEPNHTAGSWHIFRPHITGWSVSIEAFPILYSAFVGRQQSELWFLSWKWWFFFTCS